MTHVDGEEFRDFICTCDEERRQAAASLRAEVMQRLAAESETRMAHEVQVGNLVSEIVSSLNDDHDARIMQIASDQWFGVWAETFDGSFKTVIQCDAVEDGLAATWRAFADRPNPRKFFAEDVEE